MRDLYARLVLALIRPALALKVKCKGKDVAADEVVDLARRNPSAMQRFTASELESGRQGLEAHILSRVDAVRSRPSASRGQTARNSNSTQADRALPSRGD